MEGGAEGDEGDRPPRDGSRDHVRQPDVRDRPASGTVALGERSQGTDMIVRQPNRSLDPHEPGGDRHGSVATVQQARGDQPEDRSELHEEDRRMDGLDHRERRSRKHAATVLGRTPPRQCRDAPAGGRSARRRAWLGGWTTAADALRGGSVRGIWALPGGTMGSTIGPRRVARRTGTSAASEARRRTGHARAVVRH